MRLAKRALWAPAEIRAALQAARVNVIPANFYSTVPTLDEVELSFEYRTPGAEIYNDGHFDADRMAREITSLARFTAEFDPPVNGEPEGTSGFFWKNPAFSYSDAMSYYAMIRRERPARIVEIGSGYSTIVADLALRRNGFGTLVLIEPYPKPFLRRLETVERLIEMPVQDIPLTEMCALIESADIWFIDSTHTVKTGSDCLWIYLKVMPAIRRDITVHSHDIFLPFGFPKAQIRDRHVYWTEQYLLYAYMLDNPRVEVIFSSAFAQARLPCEMKGFMHDRYPGGGGSLWYRLNGKR